MNGKIAALAALLSAMALPVAASAADQSNWYAGFDAGQAHFAGLTNGLTLPAGVTSHTSDNDNSFRISGGYQFNRYFGVEGGWVDFGSAELDLTSTSPAGTGSGKIKAHGLFVVGTGMYPFTDQWSVFGRFGTIDGHKDFTWSGTGSLAGLGSNQSSTDWKLTYGVGVDWMFHSNWSARAAYDQYANIGNHNKTGEDNINVISVGIVYHF
ncbi:MAG TPA: outer membrane beta-barrel protein [Gammaproteobacteria bacterium]